MTPTLMDRSRSAAVPDPHAIADAVTVGASRARMGPNAILRVAEVLNERIGAVGTEDLFARAGLRGHLLSPPTSMVDEADVARLQWQLRADLDADIAREVAWDAGSRTGDYLLAHRIPRAAQIVLRLLPPALAARVLAQAIAKHAWTFAGSGTFHWAPGNPFVLTITHSPLCSLIRSATPACHYYAATFERIFRSLVSERARVTEVECEAAGGKACVFEVKW